MSFLGGVDLSGAAQQALTRDLELRRNDAKTTGKFSDYAYRGGADFVLREGAFRLGRQIPERYVSLRGPESCCFDNALAACETACELRYCEGYATIGYGTPIVHGWCLAPDDGVVEVTLPTIPEELAIYFNSVHMRFLPPSKWAYYGVTFATAFVKAHADDESLGLPMLDRSRAEFRDSESRGLTPETGFDTTEVHDFPVLKVRYDPNRTELP